MSSRVRITTVMHQLAWEPGSLDSFSFEPHHLLAQRRMGGRGVWAFGRQTLVCSFSLCPYLASYLMQQARHLDPCLLFS